MKLPPLSPALVFPVPDKGSPSLQHLSPGPIMAQELKPVWPGEYQRLMPDGKWEYSEWLSDGYWAATGIFTHELQEAPWRGGVLTAMLEREKIFTGQIINLIQSIGLDTSNWNP